MSRRLRRIRKNEITQPETKLLKYYPNDKFSIGLRSRFAALYN